MMKILKALAIFFIGMGLACGPARVPVPGLPGSLEKKTGLYADTAKNFSIQIPEEWEIKPGAQTYLHVISPFENPQDNFRENFNLGLYDITGKANLQLFYTVNRARLPRLVRQMKIQEESSISGNQTWRTIAINYQVNPKVRLVSLFAFAIAKNKALLVTATSTEEAFARYRPQFERSIQSLDFQVSGKTKKQALESLRRQVNSTVASNFWRMSP